MNDRDRSIFEEELYNVQMTIAGLGCQIEDLKSKIELYSIQRDAAIAEEKALLKHAKKLGMR